MSTVNTKRKSSQHVQEEARALLRDPMFFNRASTMIGHCGVVGELENRLRMFSSGLTKDHGEPVSIVVKGASSSGKNNLAKGVIKVFPPESLRIRSTMSKRALSSGGGSLDGLIYYVHEHAGARDAQLEIRLNQSEKSIANEYAAVNGRRRSAEVSERSGAPVWWTTTTEPLIFTDDETRNLSISVDESAEQTLAIALALLKGLPQPSKTDLRIWHDAIRLLGDYQVTVGFPNWMDFVATKLPISQVRVRRDWGAFLALCKVITISRCWSDSKQRSKEITFNFPDYCVAHRILATAFASTVHGVHERELSIAHAVRELNARTRRPVTVREVAAHLEWKEALAYKYSPLAVQHNLVENEGGTKEKNLKRLLPVPDPPKDFLPSRWSVFHENPDIGATASYIDPITGVKKTFTRSKNAKG
jgi:hypothetical protein